MSVKKFINGVMESLGLDEFKKSGKKKSVKRLLKKLNTRREKIDSALKKNVANKVRKEREEELAIISLQIKKGKKILDKLND